MAEQNKRRKVVIDTDCGVDDAVAISMALMHPSVEIIGITCVAGNTSLNGALQSQQKPFQSRLRVGRASRTHTTRKHLNMSTNKHSFFSLHR
jgi:hypothetical protein